jgi:antitoxin ParD1/3/4
MATMNISLPNALKDFVEEQVALRHYSTSSEYVRELIRRDQERVEFRDLLREGAESEPDGPADEAYFNRLRLVHELLDRLPVRSQAEVDAELEALREARRGGGRRRPL